MSNTIAIISPHPDDETLGCGGTILREKKNGSKIYWINITCISEKYGWKKNIVSSREKEIKKVCLKYEFDGFYNLNLPSTKLDSIPISFIIEQISNLMRKIKPNIIFMPNIHDIHTDHQVTAQAVLACTKWFRYPFIKKCLAYETLSETHFSNSQIGFKPNVYIDITKFLNKKIQIMKIYKSEIEDFPSPRSEKSIKALASFRGSSSGFDAAESFELIFERS